MDRVSHETIRKYFNLAFFAIFLEPQQKRRHLAGYFVGLCDAVFPQILFWAILACLDFSTTKGSVPLIAHNNGIHPLDSVQDRAWLHETVAIFSLFCL